MDERVVARLAALVQREPVVLASVLDTRGATPRKGGSRMLVTADAAEFSVGGGEAEARVIAAARALLAEAGAAAELHVDLSGRAGSAGVCGGTMHLGLRRWHGPADAARAHALHERLRTGERVELSGEDLGAAVAAERLRPEARLLIVGGGHCALALYDLAQYLDFDIWVFDPRAECFSDAQFPAAQRLCGEFGELARALDTTRDVYAVLLNHDFASDVAALDVLCRKPPVLLSMMGSRKRIAKVTAALPGHADALRSLQAPVGKDIDAQTPHEIAVSILAQLIQQRRARER